MEVKLKITCHKCSCSFELNSNFIKTSEISCPCCASKIPKDISAHILTGLKELNNVPTDNSVTDGDYNRDYFSFEISG